MLNILKMAYASRALSWGMANLPEFSSGNARAISLFQFRSVHVQSVSGLLYRDLWVIFYLVLRGILMSQEEGTRRAKHKAMVRPALIAGKMSTKMRNGGVPYCLAVTVVGGLVVMQR